MNAVIGMTDLALETELTAEQHEYLSTIRSSAAALLVLLNDILDYSKIEAGRLAIESVDLDVRTVVEDVAELLAPAAGRKKLALVCAVDPGLPERLRGDPVRLRQVMTNLVGNAVKFTESGEVVIDVHVLRRSAAECTLRLAVADSGIGIPPERREAIFESFTQADMSTTRRFGGSGLGLTISRHLVRLMGGRIGVDSAPGRGSTFWIELALPTAPAAEEPARPSAGRRVLVVEPLLASRRALRAQLADWGCRVRETASAEEAATAVVAERPDVALVAASLAARLASDPRLAGVRLVLCEPGGQGTHRLPSGFAAALPTPWRRATLCRTLIGAPTRAASPERGASGGLEQPLRVLLAEDNPVNRQVALYMLERLGARVDAVGNGAEAVAAAARARYDLVLMDVQMPDMDGFEATRQIRAQEAIDGPRVPIIAMTAHAMTGDRRHCLEAGMDDHVAKPVRFADLEEAVRRWGRPGAAPRPPDPPEGSRRFA
jgi:CheY-like chemotaxis protein